MEYTEYRLLITGARRLTNRTRKLIALIDDLIVQAEITALFENDGAIIGLRKVLKIELQENDYRES